MSVQRGPRGKIIVRPDKGDQDEKIRSEEVRQLETPEERVVRPRKAKRLLDAVVEPAPKPVAKKAPAKAKKSATKKKG